MKQSTRRAIAIVSLVGVLAVIIVSLLPRNTNTNNGVATAGTEPAAPPSTERAGAVILPGVSEAELASAGVYLSTPGTEPVGIPAPSAPPPPLTTVVAGAVPSTLSPVAGGTETVPNDPVDGTTRFSVDQAANAAQRLAVSMGGGSLVSAPVLARLDYVGGSTHLRATVWAVALAVRVQLPGPATTAPTPGLTAPVGPVATRVVLLFDAVTGELILNLGFS